MEDINYVSESDLELLDSYNKTEYEFEYRDILDAFNDNLVKYENNALVGYGDRIYSHGESAFIADRISKGLADLGVSKQDYVALFVNRSEWFLLASMGVLSCGAIYVPIETTYPEERIMLMLEDTQSKVVIVSDETEQRILKIICDNNLNIDALNVSAILDEGISSLNHLDCVQVDDNDVACVLYTSGTTGTPKGSLITRKAVNNFVSWYVKETKFTSDDVYGMHCSYVFDIHTAALFAPVVTGGSLYVVPEDIRLDLKALNDYYVAHNCTHTYITSQVGKLFAESGMQTTIKLLCFGGMKLGELNAPDSIGPFETYGPSENLAVSTSIFANDRMHHSSIGNFISNVKGYVLDNEHRRVPLGAVSELYLAGSQLTPGYLNRDEENNKAFFKNPFDDEEDYEQIYSTGDMVRFLPDGTLGIVGRRDGQVKIRGNRVELTEVESAIRNIDIVEDITVQVINNELVAYVVVSNNLEGNELADYVRDYVADHKPDYMVPSFVIKLDNIPLNVNGKVDKRALPEIDMDALRVEYVAPTTEKEKIIVEAFEKVFDQENISLYDDFIRLGGDSITAIRLISILQKNAVSCNAKDILSFKTPYLIAQNISDISHVSYDAVEGEVELLPIQRYFFNQVNSNEFSQSFILKSNADLDLSILQKAMDELTNVHDMLRASFRYDGDDVIQNISPLDTRVCEINEISIDNDFDGNIKGIILKSIQSLDISDNLIRINLVRYNNESYLVFVIHHLIIDGISWSILIDDLTHIYKELEQGNEADLLRPYSYKSWVGDVKKLAEDMSYDEKQHWIEINNLLDDSSIKGQSNLFSFNADSSFDVNNLLMLSEEEYLALAISRAYKKTYGKNIIFNRESHGRDDSLADVNRTVGWFTSQYPVPVNINSRHDDISLVNDVYSLKTAFNDVKHLGLNYGSLIYDSCELEFKHCPVTFNFLSSEFTFKNELFESYRLDSSESNVIERDSIAYGVTFNVSRVNDSYEISGDYANNTFIGDKFEEFVDSIKYELKFIGQYKSDTIICALNESQMGVYLDEKVNDKGTAYANSGIF